MSKALCGCIWVLALALIVHIGAAATYIVDVNHPQASDDNPGTEDKPFKSIGRAVQGLKPGDVVLIKAGEYREAITIEMNGAAGNPIVIKAYPGQEGKVIVLGSEHFTDWKQLPGNPVWTTAWKYRLKSHYPENWEDFGEYTKRCEMVFVDGKPLRQVLARGLLRLGTFFVDETKGELTIAVPFGTALKNVEVAVRQRGIFVRGSHLHLKGLTVQYVANPHDEAAFEVRGTDIVLEDCRAEWNNLDGFRLAGRRIQMRNGVANHNGRCGISASFHESLLENNTTDENSWRFGPDWHSGGMKIVGGAPSGNRVIGHTARNNNGRGIWFDYGCRSNRVERCFLHGNLIAGLEFEACLSENWAVNNIICHTRMDKGAPHERGTGVGILLYEAHRTHIYHNTIFGNERFGILIAGGARTIHYTKEAAFSAETHIVNNIIAENGVAGIGFWVWDKSAEPEMLASHRSDFNLWWQPNALVALVPVKRGELSEHVRLSSLQEWQKHTGEDVHSLVADPKFVDASHCDFRLHPDSPAVNRGKPLKEVPVDFKGGERPQGKAPDLGAYQQR